MSEVWAETEYSANCQFINRFKFYLKSSFCEKSLPGTIAGGFLEISSNIFLKVILKKSHTQA